MCAQPESRFPGTFREHEEGRLLPSSQLPGQKTKCLVDGAALPSLAPLDHHSKFNLRRVQPSWVVD